MSADAGQDVDELLDEDAPTVDYAVRASLYEVEYQTTADQDFLRSLVTDDVHSILEIPCGSGRNFGWLWETGREVVCADLEPAMVERVGERITESGAGAKISTLVADIRRFDLERRFDLVLVPQEAFQLLTDPADAEAALRRLAAHVAPGGTLLLDLHRFAGSDATRELPDYFDPAVPEGAVVVEWTRRAPGGRRLTRARQHHYDGDLVRIVYHYRLRDDDGLLGRWKSEISVRRYDLAGVRALAAAAGLTVRLALSDYDGHRHDPAAGRLITLLSAADVGDKGVVS